MPVATIDLTDEFIERVADGIFARLKSNLARHDAGAGAQSAAQADPWDGAPATTSARSENAPASVSALPGGSSGPAGNVVTDNKGRVWIFDAPGAPDCQCGLPAVQVKGQTNGKPWSQWRCAKDYDDYRNKCQFSQFVGGKR